jgi:hypothetical protein
MQALPLFKDAKGHTLNVFDAVTVAIAQDAYSDIYDKWLVVWPVPFQVIPDGLGNWLSGRLLGSTTPDKELKKKREHALQVIYKSWLGGEGEDDNPSEEGSSGRVAPDPIAVNSDADFTLLIQLVPDDFWTWQDSIESANVRNDYLNKRVMVWRRIFLAWQRVRPNTTGFWADVPFMQAWSLANAIPWPEAWPGETTDWDKFRLSRRGRIWA